jgi:hypothetical protein
MIQQHDFTQKTTRQGITSADDPILDHSPLHLRRTAPHQNKASDRTESKNKVEIFWEESSSDLLTRGDTKISNDLVIARKGRRPTLAWEGSGVAYW